MPYTLGTARTQLETHFGDATAWKFQSMSARMYSRTRHTYTFSAAAAKGQVVEVFCDLIGDGTLHRKSVWVKAVSVAPVACIPAQLNNSRISLWQM